MKHGLQNVTITGGKVTLKEGYKASLKGSGNNIVSTNNSLSNKVNGVSSSASYEEGSDKEVVIINPKNNPSTASQSTEEG